MAKKLRTKQDVKSKESFSFGRTRKNGKKAKSGTVCTFNDGTQAILLNPNGKGEKYAMELAMRTKITNDGVFKTDDDGNEVGLNCCEASYRAGYLQARKDSAKAYKAKRGGTK